MEDVLVDVVSATLEYVTTPHNVLTHIVSGALLVGLFSDGIGRKNLLLTAVGEELLILLLWLAIPNSWASILALSVCIGVYERILGPQVELKQNFSLFSVDDVTEIIRSSSPNLKFSTKNNADGSQLIETSLQYLAYRHRQWGATSLRSDDIVVDTATIRLVEEGFDRALTRVVAKNGAESSRCFCIHLKNGDGSLTVICSTKEDRDAWVAGLLYLFGKRQGDLRAAWLAKLWNEARSKTQYGDVMLDDAIVALEQTNRKVDRTYIKYSFSKLFSHKASHSSLPLSQVQFGRLFDEATKMVDLDDVFKQSLNNNNCELTMSPEQFLEFLTKEQKEKVSLEKCKKWIKASETVFPSLNLSSLGFTNLLFMDAHTVFNRIHRTVYQDMRRPLSHYFIACSHNTYLTKDQLKGKSSVDAYINAFKRGCKCVELDTWDGPNNEPIIYHGHTLTSKILFKDVIQAINDYAFVVSEYPVILSFENHCSVEQQKVMADHLKRILGSKIYSKQPAEDEKELPSPEALRGYIIVKNKKIKGTEDDASDDFEDEDDVTEEEIAKIEKDKDEDADEDAVSINGDEIPEVAPERRSSLNLKSSFLNFRNSITGSKTPKRSASSGSSEGGKDAESSKLCQDLSDLVAYCQPVRFRGFNHAKESRKHYEMSSFGENKAFKMAKEEPLAWLQYNRRMMCRIYPAGGRFDSSNYNPVPMWAVGCQLVALNYQTGARAMQLNQGLFRDNGGCGYVLKPEFMLTEGHSYDPRGPFDDSKAKMLIVKVICGHQLPVPQDKVRERQVLAEVAIEGVEQDNLVARTRSIKNSGLNPSWNEVLAFKVRVPELAIITFAVKEFPKTFLGQFTLPLRCLTEGYRRVPLENKMCEPIPQSSIFVHVQLKDFVTYNKVNDAA